MELDLLLEIVTVTKMNDKYFENDEYWKNHITKKLESDMWVDDYLGYFNSKGECLDLGCGIGQFSKKLMEYGYNVTSADISEIALEKVNEFNNNTIKIDMRKNLPFLDNSFKLVFANLSIHYFSEEDTKRLISEIRRILKDNGLFIGSVNGLEGYQVIKDTAQEIEHHYWFNKNKYIRLFDEEDLKKFLNIFMIEKIEKRETVRFNHKKNYWIFICKK